MERNGQRKPPWRPKLPEAADVYESMRHEMARPPTSAYARRVMRGEAPETLPLPFPPDRKEEDVTTVADERRETETGSATFTCPECGRTFAQAKALGGHRQRSHGVRGTSQSAVTRQKRLARLRAGEVAPPPAPGPAPTPAPAPAPDDVGRTLLAALAGSDRLSVDYGTLARLTEWIEEGKRLHALLRP